MKVQQIKFKAYPQSYSILIGNNILGLLPKKVKLLCPKANKIAVIEKGRVCEVGNHYDLIKKQGRYKEFCDKQFIETY